MNGLEITHSQLVDVGAKWLSRQSFGIVVLPEYSRASGEIPDVIGFGKRDSYVIECKTNHNDFLADKRKPFRIDGNSMGNYRYYLSHSGILSPNELPEQWGLLEYRNGRIYKRVNAIRFADSFTRRSEYEVLQSLIRRADIRGLIPQLRTEVGK